MAMIQNNNCIADDFRESLIDDLEDYPYWWPLRDALKANKSFIKWLSDDQAMGVSRVLCEAGQGAHDPVHQDHPLDFHTHLEHVINPLIEKGRLQDGLRHGEYDDRKVRWSHVGENKLVEADTLRLAVGPTSYPQCQNDINRDRADALRLMHNGLRKYRDPYAYFARGMGVVVIPLTVEGHTFIGKRSSTNEYSGLFSFVSGWATFSSNLDDIDFYQDAVNELVEEARLLEPIGSDRLRFAGLTGQPLTGETDLVFIAQTELNDSHFVDGFGWPEHHTWRAVRCSDDAKNLLNSQTSKELDGAHTAMFSTLFGLEYLINHHWNT